MCLHAARKHAHPHMNPSMYPHIAHAAITELEYRFISKVKINPIGNVTHILRVHPPPPLPLTHEDFRNRNKKTNNTKVSCLGTQTFKQKKGDNGAAKVAATECTVEVHA